MSRAKHNNHLHHIFKFIAFFRNLFLLTRLFLVLSDFSTHFVLVLLIVPIKWSPFRKMYALYFENYILFLHVLFFGGSIHVLFFGGSIHVLFFEESIHALLLWNNSRFLLCKKEKGKQLCTRKYPRNYAYCSEGSLIYVLGINSV